MSEVNPELRVPFQPDPFHVEAWLREERPGVQRLRSLIEAQPAQYRPQLRRMIREAAEAIVGSDAGTAADVEARNHASHLLEPDMNEGLFAVVDVIPVDPDAEKDVQVAQAEARAEALEQENARLRQMLASAPTGDPEDGDEPEPESIPAPSQAEQAASDALLDQALEGDLDDDELPPYSGPGADGEA